MLTYLYIALGGGLGSVARYAVSGSVARATSEVFPWGTLTANVTGCFHHRPLRHADGSRWARPGRAGLPAILYGRRLRWLHDLFVVQPADACEARDGDMTRASANVLVSVAFCLVGVWLGSAAGAFINQLKAQ